MRRVATSRWFVQSRIRVDPALAAKSRRWSTSWRPTPPLEPGVDRGYNLDRYNERYRLAGLALVAGWSTSRAVARGPAMAGMPCRSIGRAAGPVQQERMELQRR